MLEVIENKEVSPRSGRPKLEFADGLNVFVGENGTGKTHLLKLPYAMLATSADEWQAR